MKIDSTNYFVSSVGQFRSIPTKWVHRILDAVSFEGRDVTFKVGFSSIKLGNREWVPNFISASYSLSIYLVSIDGEYLLRLSDHWSDAQGGLTTIRCGNIRRCWWDLTGSIQAPVKSEYPFARSLLGGITKFSDMVER